MRCFVKLLKRVGKGLWDSENGFSADILFVLAVCLLLIAQKEYVMEAFIFKGMSYPGCNFEQYRRNAFYHNFLLLPGFIILK
jgi:hypothetical protein